MTWNKGDTVKLKTGGPIMTVDNIDELGLCDCKWFRGGEVNSETFSAEALEQASPGDDKPRASFKA